MKLHLTLAACAALIPLASAPAFAGSDPLTARLAQPVAQKVKFIAGGAMFVCEADACVAAAPSSRTFAPSTCKAIAEKVGEVVGFGASKALDAERLADCNARAGIDPTTRMARK